METYHLKFNNHHLKKKNFSFSEGLKQLWFNYKFKKFGQEFTFGEQDEHHRRRSNAISIEGSLEQATDE